LYEQHYIIIITLYIALHYTVNGDFASISFKQQI
jgi:hypothetical protein